MYNRKLTCIDRHQQLLANSLKSSIGMEQNLGIPINSAIKLVIRLNSLIEADFVADDETGLGNTGDDEITEVTIVCLDVALASTKRETLFQSASIHVRYSQKLLPFRRVCRKKSISGPLPPASLAHPGPGMKSVIFASRRAHVGLTDGT